jgi:hypothetical protein
VSSAIGGLTVRYVSIEHLADILKKNPRDHGTLCILLDELARRHTKRARKLLAIVRKLLAELESGEAKVKAVQAERERELSNDPDPAKTSMGGDATSGTDGSREIDGNCRPPDDRKQPKVLTRIRPPGTPGLPDPWIRPLNDNISLGLPQNADLPQIYAAALARLISEVKRTGAGLKQYELENGTCVESIAGKLVYEFPFSDDADLFQDAKVEVQVFGKRIEGSILSIEAGCLRLSTSEDLGPRVTRAVLLVDSTALLEALKNQIEEVGKGGIKLNRAIADAIAGKAQIPDPPLALLPATSTTDLNGAQRKALRQALTSSVTYIWGPPGCGKTHVLAEVVRSARKAGKRTLVCSNTNKAVDQLLYQTCIGLQADDQAIEEGPIVRIGAIADDKLKEFSSYVTVDGIVARKSVEFNARRERLQEEIGRIDSRAAKARDILEWFERLDMAERVVATLQQTTNEYARKGTTLKAECHSNEDQISKLEKELANCSGPFRMFRRSEGAIRQDIGAAKIRAEQLREQIEATKAHYTDARAKFSLAQAERDRQVTFSKSPDRGEAERTVADADAIRSPLVAELAEIEAKIADLRASVIKDARVLGTTCAKTYLSIKEIGQFDMVIIDEVSMVPAPIAWFITGMSKERAVVCGDFRQIPPIVPTNEQVIFDILGRDAFAAVGLDQGDANDPRMVILETQYRMDHDICGLISDLMYERRLKTAPNRVAADHAPPAPWNRPLTVVDTSDLWPFESVNAFHSRFNLMHALLARNLVWHLQREGYVCDNEDLAICTPYAAQSKLIRKLLEAEGLGNIVPVGTVHSFQGDERNAILLELPEGRGGGRMLGHFLHGVPPRHIGARLINVAISRARSHLIVLANLTHLDRLLPSSALLRHILYRMQSEGSVIPGSELLAFRPIERDLRGLVGRVKLDLDAETLGVFTQASFDAAFEADVSNARESVVIFSGFVTPTGVAKIGDLLRSKSLQNVKIRCVTRPPHLNGTMALNIGKEALDALEKIGCVVDCRARIHEKIIIVDKEIVWHGSLNVLSHTHRTDESMTRLVNGGLARALAANLAKRQQSQEQQLNAMAEAENPRCDRCGGRSVYSEGKFGPYFYCEDRCGWSLSLKTIARAGRRNSTSGGNDGLPGTNPPCPRCGGLTMLRSGPHGAFYGCGRYPTCSGKARVHGAAAKQRAKKGHHDRSGASS